MDPVHMRPIFVPPGAGTVLEDMAVTHKLTADQTDGTCYLFESTFEPGMGNRLHVHAREDEIGFVVEGALEILIEGRSHVLDTGGLARLPRGIPHKIRNPSSQSSRYLFIAVPAGLDRWFDAVTQARRDGSLDEALAGELARQYGVEWLE